MTINCDACKEGWTVMCHGKEIKCCPYVSNCPFEESEKQDKENEK